MRPVLSFTIAMTLLQLPACASFEPSTGQGTPATGTISPSASSELPGAGSQVPKPAGAAAFLQVEAERYRAAGNYAAAAASLERAMRIEPGNPWLSLALGRLRLAEGQTRQSETLARRALSRAAHDQALTAQCWELISQARQIDGDIPGAQEAARMAEQQR